MATIGRVSIPVTDPEIELRPIGSRRESLDDAVPGCSEEARQRAALRRVDAVRAATIARMNAPRDVENEVLDNAVPGVAREARHAARCRRIDAVRAAVIAFIERPSGEEGPLDDAVPAAGDGSPLRDVL